MFWAVSEVDSARMRRVTSFIFVLEHDCGEARDCRGIPSTALRAGSFSKCAKEWPQPAPHVPIWARPCAATGGYNENTRK